MVHTVQLSLNADCTDTEEPTSTGVSAVCIQAELHCMNHVYKQHSIKVLL